MKTENQDTSIYARQLAEMAAEELDPQKELLYQKNGEKTLTSIRDGMNRHFFYIYIG
jgi:hypothetical protein